MSTPTMPPALPVERQSGGASLGISSLVLGVLALLGCWIPLVNILAAVVAGLGLLLGLAGMAVAMSRRGAGIGYSIAGSVLSVLALLPVLIMGTILAGGIHAVRQVADEAARSNPATRPALFATPAPTFRPLAAAPVTSSPAARLASTSSSTVPPSGAVTRPVTNKPALTPPPGLVPAEQWFPAAAPVMMGTMQVRIAGVAIGHVTLKDPLNGGMAPSRDVLLGINVELVNKSPTLKRDYRTWDGLSLIGRDFAVLTDNFGNAYRRIDFGPLTPPVARVDQASIYPGRGLTDLLVFERPVQNVQYLKLELPAENFGGEGVVRFQIPAGMIQTLQ